MLELGSLVERFLVVDADAAAVRPPHGKSAAATAHSAQGAKELLMPVEALAGDTEHPEIAQAAIAAIESSQWKRSPGSLGDTNSRSCASFTPRR